jgi:peptidoglycan/xylan/chitin deacetylase (PgdA/CDA1 family)
MLRRRCHLIAHGVLIAALLGGLATRTTLRADDLPSVTDSAPIETTVTPPPADAVRRLKLDPVYTKHVAIGGFSIVASAGVPDVGLREAAWLIQQMIGHRPDILATLNANGVRFVIMNHDQWTTAVPEHSDLTPKDYWDRRARGLGATPVRPAVSCGVENLLRYPGDPYAAENILIHEFGHAIHEMGLKTLDVTFDARLKATYQAAIDAGLWKEKYASGNKQEYWAEGVQSWFDTNREHDHDHNHVNTRVEIREYDPGLAALLEEVFGDGGWRYTRPETRRHLPHLADWNPERQPTFAWPDHLAKTATSRFPPRNSSGAAAAAAKPSRTAQPLKPWPEKLAILTFDDGVVSHATVVAPLLKEYGFGGTFFVCEFPPDFDDKTKYMTWEQIKELHDLGFEVASHTRTHKHVDKMRGTEFVEELRYIENQCVSLGMPRPINFAYPAYVHTPAAIATLKEQGYRFARIGGGKLYDPETDDPYLIPSFSTTGDQPDAVLKALGQAERGKVVVLTVHGVPDTAHPWVNTPPELFRIYLEHLKKHNFTVIALRDLEQYLPSKSADE